MFLSERVEATPSNITPRDPVYNDSLYQGITKTEKYESPTYVPQSGGSTDYDPQLGGSPRYYRPPSDGSYKPQSGGSPKYEPTSSKSEHIYTDILDRFSENLDDSSDGQLVREANKNKVDEDGNNEEDKNIENT